MKDLPTAQLLFKEADFAFEFKDGHCHLGGFIGSDEARQLWLEPKIQEWINGVQALAKVAKRFLQTAFTDLAKSLQSE